MVIQPGGNRNSKNLPVTAEGREWSNGLCSCCDEPGTCAFITIHCYFGLTDLRWLIGIVACCFPCITYGKTKVRYDQLQHQGTVAHDPGCVNGDCMLHAVASCFGLHWVVQVGFVLFLVYSVSLLFLSFVPALFRFATVWSCHGQFNFTSLFLERRWSRG